MPMLYQIPTFVRLFPLLLPIWQERPLTTKDISPGPYPIEATAEDVRLQAQACRVANLTQRCQIARDLRNSGRADAHNLLLQQLRNESHPVALATLLECLASVPVKPAAPLPDAERWLGHDDPNVRYWAAVFYPNLTDWEPEMLARMCRNDSDARIRMLAADILAEHPETVGMGTYVALLAAGAPDIRAAAVRGLCRKAAAADAASYLESAAADPDVAVRYQLADNLDAVPAAIRIPLTTKLAKDAHPSVRGALAAGIGRHVDDDLFPTLRRLCADRDADVRRRAAASLAAFPKSPTRQQLVHMLGDARYLVRREAEDSLCKIHSRVPVIEAVAARIGDDFEPARLHVYRVLGRLGARDYARALAARLPREKDAEILAAVVDALYEFNADFAAAQIAGLHQHADPRVRCAVARALGRFAQPATYQVLGRLAFDPEETVRHNAIIGIGRIGNGTAFSDTLLRALETVNSVQMSPRNRAAAAWAAGRTRPVRQPLVDRLVVQATVPVVPGPLGPEFESDVVLVSVSMALAQCARDMPALREHAKYVQKVHSTPIKHEIVMIEDVNLNAPMRLAPSLELLEYTRQIEAYMNNRSVAPQPRPVQRLDFQYSVLQDTRRYTED